MSWYYGLDHHHGTNVDLLAVVLHELGHGLGFSSFVDPATGDLFQGMPDIFSRFILDATTGKRWNDMTDAERRASAINTRRVVWDGDAVALRAPSFLGPRPRMLVNAPAAIAGDLEVLTADFGPPPSTPGITASVVLVDDRVGTTSDACTAIMNGAQVSGNIALIDRGLCPFTSKARAAQAAGAVGVLIANNEPGLPAALPGSDPSIAIPVMGITQEDGNAIKAQLGNGVNATIGLDPAHLAGANDAGKVLLYMPRPVEVGSSVSHWDPSATPDLLMEPFLTEHLTSEVDLTRPVFEDIGWFSTPTGGTNAAVRMLDNYPNPFRPHDRPQTTLQFELDRATTVELGIYDMGGRLVRRLFEGALGAGNHTEFSWDGSDDQGRPVDSGVYLCRAKAGKHSSARRVTVVR
jgi:hypothetical protein